MGAGKKVKLCGYHKRGIGNASKTWADVCAANEKEFSRIRKCHPGTFNVELADDKMYKPPGDDEYNAAARKRPGARDGNHISPRAKVVAMNGTPVDAWIYRGELRGRGDNIIELLAERPLLDLTVAPDRTVVLEIEEFGEGEPGMPLPPGGSSTAMPATPAAL
jgi:hypothetical protein